MKEMFNSLIPEVEKNSTNSGSVSFGDFHPGNLIFDVKIGRNPMIQTHIIDPEFIDMNCEHDRLEDMANFFTIEAVDQYRLDKSLTRLSTNMKSFLSGYNEILALEKLSLDSLYPSGYIPLNFHLALMILLSILNIQGMRDIFDTDLAMNNEISLRCELIGRLLEWPTFPD